MHCLCRPGTGAPPRGQELMQVRFAYHLHSPDFRPNGQLVAVGVQPAPDGDGVFVVLKVENCIDVAQAEWIAQKAGADLHTLLGADPAEEAVMKHCYQESAGGLDGRYRC